MVTRWPCNLQQARFYSSLRRTSWTVRCRFSSTASSSSSQAYTIASLLSRELTPPESETITINGFVRSVRKQKRVAFAALADGSAMQPLQAVLTPAQAEPLTNGTGVRLKGHWVRCPEGKEQSHELHASEVEVLGIVDATSYPIQKQALPTEYLRSIPHLRTRTPFNSLLLRLRSHAIACLTQFFADRGFIQAHPPVISSSDCEGAGEVFTVVADGAGRCRTDHTQASQDQVSGATSTTDFFRAPKYLTVSSQLHLEALAHAVGNVWALAPAFRAERSDTARHLSEFYMLEAETSFTDGLEPVMALLEALLAHLAADLLRSRLGSELLLAKRNGEGRCAEDDDDKDEIGKAGLKMGSRVSSSGDGDDGASAQTAEQLLRARWRGLAERRPWPRITYSDAIEQLKAAAAARKVNFEHAPCWGAGLQAEHETFLANTVGAGQPVFVTDFPSSIKPFYMAPSSSAQQQQQQPLVACFDLLVPGMGEIAGGSLREHRLEPLVQSMREHGLVSQAAAEALLLSAPPPSATIVGQPSIVSSLSSPASAAQQQPAAHSLQWYIDLRRWGSVPHGGFGLGFDRLLAYLAGVSNVREVVAFPRWAGRCLC